MTGELTTSPTGKHLPRPVRLIRTRPRLFLSVLLGLVTIAILFATCDWRVATKLLIGWDIGVGLYLVLALSLMARSDLHRIRRRAANQDEGGLGILVLTVAAAAASLGAIFAELATVGGAPRQPGQLILATATVVLSWAFIHSIFALHYAHEFYGEGRDRQIGGMTFPDDHEPDYWDFMYFSFTIGMCAQVSDVTVSSKSIRRTVLTHSIIAFLFNVTLLALTVNIAASAI
ncbi:MAG: hypothetical protein QOH67_1973 [Hyphomicrobiales bacterium]|jgi:uncharacterized membrane protein|nr:hypothetical protein [Hyphomicrobiales bacterium]